MQAPLLVGMHDAECAWLVWLYVPSENSPVQVHCYPLAWLQYGRQFAALIGQAPHLAPFGRSQEGLLVIVHVIAQAHAPECVDAPQSAPQVRILLVREV